MKRLEVLLGLLCPPCSDAFGQRLQVKRAVARGMAGYATGVARPILQEDGFDLSAVYPRRDHYRQSDPFVQIISPVAEPRSSLIGIYSRLLDRIAASGYEVPAQRVRVPAWEKVWILARSLV